MLKKEKPLVKCTHPHFCYDWDSMFITPLMPEFECCVCECDGNGATKMSDFYGLDAFEQICLIEYLDSLKG